MNTIDARWRWAVLLPVAGVVLWWNWTEPVAIWLVMMAPVIRVGLLYHEDWRRRFRAVFTAAGIGTGVAVAMHVASARNLGGHLLPAELLWTAWFFAGLLVLLEGLDRGLTWALKRMRQDAVRSVVRLIVIVAVVAPSVVAVMQTVRVKVGYQIPQEVRALQPIHFYTRTSDGLRIRGMYFDRGADATVVMAHGLGAHSENFTPFLVPLLEDYPVNGLIFDFRAHGYSDNHVTSFGYHETRDLEAVLDWLNRNHPEAAERLIFYGFSMGAAATAAVARRTPGTLGVVIDSGYARLRDVARAMANQLPPGLGHYVYYSGLPLASAIAWAPLHRLEPVRDIERLQVPLRVLHGSADAFIPADQGRELMERGRGTGRIVPGADHSQTAAADPGYFFRVGRFIELLLASPADDPPDEQIEGIGPAPEPAPEPAAQPNGDGR